VDKLPLSVLLLARDEERQLEELLPALGFAREVVVVVDAATRDRTREVAAGYGARVCERPLEDFGRQRRFGLEQCRESWVLWLDADERIDAAAERSIRQAIESSALAGYRIARRTWFLGRPILHCGWGGERVLRLFRREAAEFPDAAVHERVTIRGAVGDLPGTIEHRSYEHWSDCRDKLFRYAAAGAEQARRSGRRAGPLDAALRPPLRFLRMYLFQAGFLDGSRGLAVCLLGAAQVWLKYMDLWLAWGERRGRT
jgi:glycosyltransferase involved in cell wall biosynthesis